MEKMQHLAGSVSKNTMPAGNWDIYTGFQTNS